MYFKNLDVFFNQSLLVSPFIFDEISLFISLITVFVLYISYLFTSHSSRITFVLIFIFVFCILVFGTDSLFKLYFSYEASLLPILYIILKWGSYPDRSLRAIILLLYTSIFTFPFLYFIFITYSTLNTFILPLYSFPFIPSSPLIFSLLIFLTFAVKLPIYGLHFWLPIAHVEAPTFGSIILAGVLLKLGGAGLIRLSPLIDIHILLSILLSYFMVGLFLVTLICGLQSDFKRLIAFSSVSHIMTIPFIILANSYLSFKSVILVIIFHGLSSPLLFILVGVTYSLFRTRQLVYMRGLLTVSPILRFILVLAFFFRLSAPPFPSFIGEVLFIMSTLCIREYLPYLFLAFAFFSLVYNLNWLSSIIFTSSPRVNNFF